MKLSPQTRQHEQMVRELRPHFHRVEPRIVSAVLAELTATYLVGFAQRYRDELLDEHVEFIKRLVPVIEGIQFGGAGHPEDRH